MGLDSLAGIAIRYGRSGAEVETLKERDFLHMSRGPWAHPVFCTMGTGSLSGGKAVGAWR